MPSNYWAQMQSQAQAVGDPTDTPTDEEMLMSQSTDGAIPIPESPEEAQSMGMSPEEFQTLHGHLKAGNLVPVGQKPPMEKPDKNVMDLAKRYGDKQAELINQQQSGVNQIQNMINQYGKQPQEYDPRYLAAFADIGESNPHWLEQAQKMMPTGEGQKKQQQMIALQEALQQRKEGLTKSQADALKEQIAAYKAGKDDSLTKDVQRSTIAKNLAFARQRPEMQLAQQDERAHSDVLNKIKTDKILGQRQTQVANLDNALNAFEQGTATPQQFAELQQAVRSNMGLKGNSGIGEREATQLKAMGINAAAVKQFITGSPQDINQYVNPEMIAHVKKLVSIEKANVQKQADTRVNALIAGRESVYKRRPEKLKDLQSAKKAVGQQFGMENVPGEAPPNVGDVVEGHVYKGGDPANPNSWEQQ